MHEYLSWLPTFYIILTHPRLTVFPTNQLQLWMMLNFRTIIPRECIKECRPSFSGFESCPLTAFFHFVHSITFFSLCLSDIAPLTFTYYGDSFCDRGSTLPLTYFTDVSVPQQKIVGRPTFCERGRFDGLGPCHYSIGSHLSFVGAGCRVRYRAPQEPTKHGG